MPVADCRFEEPQRSERSAIGNSQSAIGNFMHRTERFTDTLREEIAEIVGYELEDPRLTTVTVTDVRLSSDKRAARVYVTVAGDEAEHKSALNALNHAAPYVRKQLGLSLNLPRTPELYFVRDRIEEQGERVDQLLREIEEKKE
jgi:ribosome-binding factor A